MDHRNLYINSQTFCFLVDIGSFSGVAKKLSISQSTVSRRITALEDALELQMIKRSTRKLLLTEDGERYYQFFKQQDQQFISGIQSFNSHSSSEKIIVRLALPMGISNVAISPYLGEFLQNNKQLTLHLFYQNREVDLIKENYDLVILRHIPKQQTLKVRKLYHTTMQLYCSPEYITRYGKPDVIDDLAQHLVIGGIHDDNTISFKTTVVDPMGREVIVENYPRCLTNNLEPSYRLALNGHAIVGGTDFLFQKELSEGRLIEVLPEYRFASTDFFLVRVKSYNHPIIDKLIDFIEDCFKRIK